MSRSWDSDQLLFIVRQDRKREILRLFNMGEIELERSRLQGCRGFDTWTSLGIKPLTRLLEHASLPTPLDWIHGSSRSILMSADFTLDFLPLG